MTIREGLLPVGQGFNIRTFIEDGAHINHKPIQVLERIYIESIPVYNSNLSIALDFDFIPIACWFQALCQGEDGQLFVEIAKQNNETIHKFLIGSSNTGVVESFTYNFPFICIPQEYKIIISTETLSVYNLFIFGEKAILNKPIFPQLL